MDRSEEDKLRVPSDLYCFDCGYNLRTMELGSVCPECGSPVRRSVRLADAEDAKPKLNDLDGQTLARTFAGLTWLLVGHGMSLVILLGWVMDSDARWRNRPWHETPDRLVLLVVLASAWVCFCRGVMLLGKRWGWTWTMAGMWMLWPAVVGGLLYDSSRASGSVSLWLLFGGIALLICSHLAAAMPLTELARRADDIFGIGTVPSTAVFVLLASVVSWLSFFGHRPFNSLDLITLLAAPMSLPPAGLAPVPGLEAGRFHRNAGPLLPAIAASIQLTIVFAIWRLRRAVKQAGAARTTGASSRP